MNIFNFRIIILLCILTVIGISMLVFFLREKPIRKLMDLSFVYLLLITFIMYILVIKNFESVLFPIFIIIFINFLLTLITGISIVNNLLAQHKEEEIKQEQVGDWGYDYDTSDIQDDDDDDMFKHLKNISDLELKEDVGDTNIENIELKDDFVTDNILNDMDDLSNNSRNIKAEINNISNNIFSSTNDDLSSDAEFDFEKMVKGLDFKNEENEEYKNNKLDNNAHINNTNDTNDINDINDINYIDNSNTNNNANTNKKEDLFKDKKLKINDIIELIKQQKLNNNGEDKK